MKPRCVAGRQKIIVMLAMIWASWAASGHAAVIVQYTFTSGALAPTTTGAGVTASNINNTGSNSVIEPGNTVPDTLFVIPSLDSPAPTTPSDSVAQNYFFQFTVTPGPGTALHLTNLTFDTARGGPSTPRGWLLRSSVDNFATDIDGANIPTIAPQFTTYVVDLSDPDFQDLTAPLTFRVYTYVPSNTVGIFFDNMTLNDNTEAIAEPASLAVLGAGLLGIGLARRRRAA